MVSHLNQAYYTNKKEHKKRRRRRRRNLSLSNEPVLKKGRHKEEYIKREKERRNE